MEYPCPRVGLPKKRKVEIKRKGMARKDERNEKQVRRPYLFKISCWCMLQNLGDKKIIYTYYVVNCVVVVVVVVAVAVVAVAVVSVVFIAQTEHTQSTRRPAIEIDDCFCLCWYSSDVKILLAN